MADSPFIANMNVANTAFGAIASETFQLARTGVTGEYTALSIDELSSTTPVTAGGLRGDNDVSIWISRDVMTASGVVEGSVLVVRGKRVRVNKIADEGDNAPMLQCTTAGVKF